MKLVIEVELEENKRSDDTTYLSITSVKKDGVKVKSEFDSGQFWTLLDDEGDISLVLLKESL
jgi:hypothetical protein